MKTDSIFNRFFREFPGEFFTLIGENQQKAERYEFTSVEAKEQRFRATAYSSRKRIYLTALPEQAFKKFPLNLLKIIIDSKQEALATAETIIGQLPQQVQDEKEQEVIIDLLINLLLNKFPQMSREEILKMFEPLLSDVKKSRAYREIANEGKQEEKRKMARSLLRKKMTLEFISEVTGLSPEELRALKKGLAQRKN
jgi:predicted transposase YdaD